MTEVKPVAWTQQSSIDATSDGTAIVGAFWQERDVSEHRLKYDDPYMPDDVALYAESDFIAMKERAEKAEAELERTKRNRDMYKGQCDRQAKELEALRKWMRGK